MAEAEKKISVPFSFTIDVPGRGLTDFTLSQAGEEFSVNGGGLSAFAKTPEYALLSLPFIVGKKALEIWKENT